VFGLLLALQLATLSAQKPSERCLRPRDSRRTRDGSGPKLDAIRNIGLTSGRIAVITTEAIRGRDTVDARGLVVASFID
jgi:hypothetical protein